MKRKKTPMEKISRYRKQLAEYLKLDPKERLEEFEKLKKAVTKAQAIVLKEGISKDLVDIDAINSDSLLLDVELIPFWMYSNTVGTVDLDSAKSNPVSPVLYIRYDHAKELDYPNLAYTVVDAGTGKCNLVANPGTESYFFSKRVAVDHSLFEIAKRWHDIFLPAIEKALEAKTE